MDCDTFLRLCSLCSAVPAVPLSRPVQAVLLLVFLGLENLPAFGAINSGHKDREIKVTH